MNYGQRARFGMMVPSGNVVAEAQFSAMFPADIAFHVTRLRLTGSSREELEAMAENVEEASSLLADVKPDLIGFHCTAVSTLSEDLENSILTRARAASEIEVVATSQAIIGALKALEAKSVVLISPYVEHINASEIAYLKRRGIEVIDAVGLGIYHASEMAKVEPQRWYDLAMSRRHPDADAYFISCTAIRSLEVIEPLEHRLGKPVITSNQTMAWHMLRTTGVEDRLAGCGRLLARH